MMDIVTVPYCKDSIPYCCEECVWLEEERLNAEFEEDEDE